MNGIKLSIIIPLYNREYIVKKSIESVLSQSYIDFELIVVDDCSTDNSYNTVKMYKDKRIILFRLEKNSGPAAARNYGVEKASGNFISFLDSDDYYESDFLEKTIETIQNSNSDVGFWYTGLIYHENRKINKFYWNVQRKHSPYLTILHELRIGSGTGITVRKEAFDYVKGFNVKLPAAEDTDFFLRFSKCFDFEGIPYFLVNINKNGTDRVSKDFKKIAIAYNSFIPEHLDTINKYQILKKKFYYKLMWLNFHLKDIAKAKGWYDLLKENKLLNFKMRLVYFIYRLLPLMISIRIHTSISNVK